MKMNGFGAVAWFEDEHRAYTDMVARFVGQEIAPHSARWYEEGKVDRELWRKAGELGILGAAVDPDFGGAGGPRSFDAITLYQHARSSDTGWGIAIQQCVIHYIAQYGTPAQKQHWLPRLVSGSTVAALAMTEPSAGSDVRGIRTRAVRDIDGYRLSGSKTFITNGGTADMACLVVKTDPGAGTQGISLMLVDLVNQDGFHRGTPLKKIGMKGNDTAELFFDDARIPADALLGAVEGRGFYQLMEQLAWERLVVGVVALGQIDFTIAETLSHAQTRHAFGKRLMDQQNTRFKLAEAATLAELLRSFVADCVGRLDRGELDSVAASMVKWWGSQVQCAIADDCVQIFGGYGFMQEYPVARQFADSRVQKIYGGANEIMKELIARALDK